MRRILALVTVALTLSGAPGIAAAADKAPVLKQAGTGTLRGTAQNASGRTLGNYTVQLRDMSTGQLTGSTTSSAAGAFAFAGLVPGNYAVEIVNAAGQIIGTSALTAVVAGATVLIAVTAPAVGALTAGTGISTAILLTTIAAGAGITGAIVAGALGEASPSR